MAIRLPPLTQSVRIDTTDLNRAIAQARRFEAAMKRSLDTAADTKRAEAGQARVQASLDETSKRSRDASKETAALSRAQDEGGKSAGKQATSLGQLRRALDEKKKATVQAARETGAYSEELEEADGRVKTLTARVAGLTGVLNRHNRQLSSTTRLTGDLGSEAATASRDVNTLGRGLQSGARDTDRFNLSIGKLAPSLRGLKFGGIGVGVAALVPAISQLVPLAAGLGNMIGPVAGLAGVLPGLVGGFGALAGVLVAGLKGNEAVSNSVSALGERLSYIQGQIQRRITPAFTGLFDAVGDGSSYIAAGARVISDGLVPAIGQLELLLRSNSFKDNFATIAQTFGQQLPTLTRGLVGFVGGFTALGAAAGPVQGQIIDGFARMGDRFKAFIDRTRASGQLQTFLQDAFDKAQRLGGIFGDLGTGILNLGRVAAASGLTETLFSAFERGAAGFRDFTSLANGPLVSAFQNVSRTAEALGPVISGIGTLILTTFSQINLVPLLTAISSALPVIGNIVSGAVSTINAAVGLVSTVLQNAGGGISRFFSALGSTVGDVVRDITPAVGEFSRAIGRTFSAVAAEVPKVGAALSRVLPPIINFGTTLANVATAVLPVLVQGIGILVDVLGPLVSLLAPIGTVISTVGSAFGGLPPLLVAAGLAFVAFRRIVSTATAGVGTAAAGAATSTAAAATGIRGTLVGAGQSFVGFGQTVRGQMRLAGDDVGRVAAATGGLQAATQRYLPGVAAATGGISAAFREASTQHAGMVRQIGNLGTVDRFGSTMAGLGAATRETARTGFGALARAGSGLFGAMGGPWGVAITGAIVGFTAYSSAVAESKARMEAARTAGDNLFDAYAQIGTVNGSAAGKAREAAIEQAGLGEAFKNSGVAVNVQRDALAGNADAQQRVLDGLRASREEQEANTAPLAALWNRLTGAYNDNEEAAEELFDGVGTGITSFSLLANSIDETLSPLDSYRQSVETIFGASSILATQTGNAATQLQTFAGQTTNANSQLSVLNETLSNYGANTMATNDAAVASAQAMSGLAEALNATDEAGNKVGLSAVNAAGGIDASTAAGQQLIGAMNGVKGGYDASTTAAYNSALASGGVAAAAAAAGAAATTARDDFINQAEALGLTRDQAIALADQYGLIPGSIVTQVSTPGMTAAQTAANILRDNIDEIKDSKTVVTRALTEDAMASLRTLGYTVNVLPDGRVEVTANTGPAAQAVNDLVSNINYRKATINVGIGGPGAVYAAAKGAILGSGRGGVQHQMFAGGGMHNRLNKPNMQANKASIVAPKTYRVIGDRAQHDEAYIPINNSRRSMAILKQTAERMGYSLDAQVKRFADGGLEAQRSAMSAFVPSSRSTAAAVAADQNLQLPSSVAVSVQIGDRDIIDMIRQEIRAEMRTSNSQSARALSTTMRS